MATIPSIFLLSSGGHRVYPGVLFQLPEQLINHDAIQEYLSLHEEGWHITRNGYRTYIKFDEDNNRYVFPGLIIEGFQDDYEQIDGYDTSFDQGNIESYALTFAIQRDDLKKEVQEDMNLLVHDLRRLNSSLYNKAFACLRNLKSGSFKASMEDAQNVLSVVELLKLRTDTIDIVGNLNVDSPDEIVKMSEVIADVLQSFRPSLVEHGLIVNRGDQNFTFCRAPELFKLVPYLIIDNAVKYSPLGESIDVEFFQDNDFLYASFSSFGPLIEEDEKEKIFTRGSRGKFAIESTKPGSGYGMFLAKQLLMSSKGNIAVSSDLQPNKFDVIPIAKNTFTIHLPIYKAGIRNSGGVFTLDY